MTGHDPWEAYRRAGLARAARAVAYRATGALDPGDVRPRLAEAGARHPVLCARLGRRGRWEPGRPPELWVESLPYAGHDVRATRLRGRIMGYPIDPLRGPVVRVTLLSYLDGARHLLVAAHWLALDERGLHALTGLLAGAAGIGGLPWPYLPPLVEPPAPEWAEPVAGPPRRRTIRARLSRGADHPDAVIEALAASVARRTGDGSAVVALRRTGSDGARLLRAGTAPRPRDAPCDVELWLPPDGAPHDTLERLGPHTAGPGPAALALALDDEHLACTYRADLVPDQMARGLLAEVVGDAPPPAVVPPPWTPPSGALIHDLVAGQAAARPDAVAVVSGSTTLTYRELDEWAGAIAARLNARGIAAGHRVGVCLPRGPALIAALLGVLRAGAAYVPLDPTYPAERLRYLVADAGVSVVLREDAMTSMPESAPGPPVRAPRRAAMSPRDPAYVIYTSGSTGRPKGVVVEHRSVAALLGATRERFGLGRRDVWTFFHSCAFDFSVWEIWGCLTTGGRLVVVPEDVAREPAEFRDLLRAERVTVLNQTPSALIQLLCVDRRDPPELAVRLLILGGEPLDARTLLPWFDQRPERECQVFNMYGITETTVHCTWTRVTRRDALSASRCVGTALPGWTVSVLDPFGRPLPPGIAGEIHVGGAGVARGYLGRPGLTARRFRPDHLHGNPGDRLYGSGDRGRLRPDGRIDHLGRLDGQVKVRGYRIELDEIRVRLGEDPRVRAAVVVLNRRGDTGDAHLDAYVVGRDVDPLDLRARLARTLPAYMLPSSITVLDALPLTENGKLDARRLPAPSAPPRPPPPADPGPPGPDDRVARAQARIVRIWEDLLGTTVLPDDNFFLVGGNSLIAIRVLTRLRHERLASAVTARILYRNPTPRGLAEALTRAASLDGGREPHEVGG